MSMCRLPLKGGENGRVTGLRCETEMVLTEQGKSHDAVSRHARSILARGCGLIRAIAKTDMLVLPKTIL